MSNRKLLITGASCFVGKSLYAELRSQGYWVRGAVRSASAECVGNDYVEVGAIGSGTDWSTALRDVDVVVHLAARVHVMHDTVVDPLAEFRKVKVHKARGQVFHYHIFPASLNAM